MIPLHEIFLRLALAAVLGAIIGVEREIHRRPAGIRTSLLVCLSCALFTILSGEIARRFGENGATRIASNIVQGIGFLGAGAILRESGSVIGLTTAATIFVEAAIGMAAGGGLYTVAVYATGLVLFALFILAWLEHIFHLKPRIVAFRFMTASTENIATELQRLLYELKIKVRHFRAAIMDDKSVVEFDAEVSEPRQHMILQRFHRPGVVAEATPLEGRHE